MKMIIKDRSRTRRHVSRTHRAALDLLFDRINLDSKMQIKCVDTKNQLADMLTKGRFTKDEWNHLLRLLNIMNFSTFYCSHFSHFLPDPPRKQKTVSKRGQEEACEFKQGQGETHELGVSARNSSVQNWVTPTTWRMRRIAISSLTTLGITTETGRIIQSKTCGTRIGANGQLRCRLLCRNAKAHDFARTSHDSCQVNQNQCMWSQLVYVEPAPEAQLDSSKVWLCKNAFQGLKIYPQAWCIHSTQKINDMNYSQLISDSSTYAKKRAQRSDDSILLRHMDDMVGTGPEEHLMGDFEHVKTCQYLTDVVVLRHESDTVNFLGLEITKTTERF